jgi:hypothetical protein
LTVCNKKTSFVLHSSEYYFASPPDFWCMWSTWKTWISVLHCWVLKGKRFWKFASKPFSLCIFFWQSTGVMRHEKVFYWWINYPTYFKI